MMRTSRLWPLLVVLAALVSGAVALDVYASSRSVAPIVVTVSGPPQGAAEDESTDEDEGSGAKVGETAAVSPEHASARDLGRRGEIDGAITAFRQVAEKHPDSADVAAELGYWLLRARRTDEAVEVLSAARSRHPDDAHLALNLGVALRRVGELAKAEEVLRQAVKQRPGYHSARIALARVLERNHKAAEAIELLREGSRSGGNLARAEVLVALGSALLSDHRGKEADQAIEQAIHWAPAEPSIRITAAKAYLSSSSKEDKIAGMKLASQAVDLAPDLAAVHVVLARAREKVGDQRGAEASYAQALRLDPGYAYARRRLIRLALDREDVGGAQVLVARLLTDQPNDPEPHFLAGAVAAAAERLPEARQHYADAIEKAGGTYPEAYFNLGLLEKRNGDLDAAVSAYQRAVEQRPSYAVAWNNLGLVHMTRKDAKASREAFEKAIQIDARYGAARLNLAKLESGEGRYDRAIALLGEALKERPRYREALLNLGVAYRKSGRAGDAIATYRTLIDAYPRYVLAWSNLGYALAEMGKPRDAMEAYRRALELDPEHVSTLRDLAALQQAQGLLSESQQTFEALLEQKADDAAARLALAEVLHRQRNLPACAAEVKKVLTAEPQNEGARKILALCEGAAGG